MPIDFSDIPMEKKAGGTAVLDFSDIPMERQQAPIQIVSEPVPREPAPTRQPLRKLPRPRDYGGFLSEVGRVMAGQSLDITGTMGQEITKSLEELWGPTRESERILNWTGKLRAMSKRPSLSPAKDAGVRGFVAQAIGQAAPYMALTVGSTLATGTPAAAFGVAYTVEGQEAYDEAIAAGASEKQARVAKDVVGIINGAIEQLQVGHVLRFARGPAKRALLRAASKKATANLIKRGAKATAKLAAREGLEEALQEAAQVGSVSVFRPVTRKEALERIGKGAAGGAIVGPVFGGAGRLAMARRIAGEPELTRPPAKLIAKPAKLAKAPVAKPPAAKLKEIMEKAIRRYESEEAGQAILEELDAQSKTVQNVSKDFWRNTYPLLTAKAKAKFEGYLKRITGFEPGSVMATKEGKPSEIARDWPHIAEIVDKDLSAEIDGLQGTERGYVALMAGANATVSEVKAPEAAEDIRNRLDKAYKAGDLNAVRNLRQELSAQPWSPERADLAYEAFRLAVEMRRSEFKKEVPLTKPEAKPIEAKRTNEIIREFARSMFLVKNTKKREGPWRINYLDENGRPLIHEHFATYEEAQIVYKARAKELIQPEAPPAAPKVELKTPATYEKIVEPIATGKPPAKVAIPPPVGPAMATNQQKARAHIVARNKGLISEKGKPKPSYRRFAKAMTGKPSMLKMTEEEAEHFANMLDALIVDRKGIAHIPTRTNLITKELADKIGKFREIGYKEQHRPAKRVFEKIGLRKEVFERAQQAEVLSMEELMAFRKEVKQLQKLVGSDKHTSRKLFRAMESPGSVKLTENEKKVVAWGRKFFNDWGRRLHLPAERRRKNYITHIFEREIAQNLKEKHPIDPDLIRALDFITPKTVFNPFLQRRLGKEVGVREDFWAALQAYEGRALKSFYYQPLVKHIRVYEKFLPPNAARYLRGFITRITSRPLVIDRQINHDLKEAADAIEKLPGGERIAPLFRQGNASGMMAYNMTGLMYEAWLGLRPASAIKNLSQHGLALAEVGARPFYKALKTTGRTRKQLLSNSWVLRSRATGYLPGIDQTFIKSLESKRRKVTMAMFRAADRKNVSDAFLAGYYEAKEKGLPDNWAFKRGDEVAAKTQYLYSKFSGSQFMQSSPGRILGMLTTWPINFAELMNDWVKGKPSYVYQDYQKATGRKVLPTGWLARRSSVMIYMGLLMLAAVIERETRLKAKYYTGWTSWGTLADLMKGKLPGLTPYAIMADLTAGIISGDKTRIKRAWGQIRNLPVIQKEIRDILSGKKGWLNLFVYLEAPKKEKKPTGRRRSRGRTGR